MLMSEAWARLVEELAREVADRVEAMLRERLDGLAVADSPYLTVAEAADLLRAKPQRVYDLLSSGRLPKYRDGARVLIRRADLDEHLRAVDPALTRAGRRRMNGAGVA
jgi:excisionase family DNA binding protein